MKTLISWKLIYIKEICRLLKEEKLLKDDITKIAIFLKKKNISKEIVEPILTFLENKPISPSNFSKIEDFIQIIRILGYKTERKVVRYKIIDLKDIRVIDKSLEKNKKLKKPVRNIINKLNRRSISKALFIKFIRSFFLHVGLSVTNFIKLNDYLILFEEQMVALTDTILDIIIQYKITQEEIDFLIYIINKNKNVTKTEQEYFFKIFEKLDLLDLHLDQLYEFFKDER